jgi:hypothetical protein
VELPHVTMYRTKTIFSLILTVFIFSFSAHNNLFAQSFSIGVKAGVSVNWASFGDKDQKDTFKTKPVFGYSAGFQIGFPLKNNYEFLAEGGFSKEGRKLTYGTSEHLQNLTTYNFAEGTMLLRRNFKVNFAKNVPGTWFLAAGPEVAYWMSSKGYFYGAEKGPAYEVVFDEQADGTLNKMYLNEVNRWLWGIVLSAGVKAPLQGHQKIAAELRFVSGHTYLGNRHSSLLADINFMDTQLTNLKSFNIVVTYFFDFNVQESRKGKSTLKKHLKKTR